jgi:SH3 domain-containing protein
VRRRHFLQSAAAVALWLPAARVAAQAAQSALSPGAQAIVATDGLNLRGGPGASQPVVGTLSGGAQVDVLGSSLDGAWWRIASDSGIGYVSAEFLQATAQPNASAAFDLDLPIPYARQLNAIWCDPADLQMWMTYHQGRAATDGGTALQQSIWDWETSHNAGFSVDQWDCSPYAVASAAHHVMPDVGFDHFQYDSPLGGSRVLAWLLSAYREPSIALIWQGLHYVLVRGVRASGNPAQDPDGVELHGFYVADPYPGASFFLGQDRFIPIDRWLGELFSPVSYLTPHTGVPGDVWQNRSVAIQRAWSAAAPTERGQRNATPLSYASAG